jgi:hypothetical protein
MLWTGFVLVHAWVVTSGWLLPSQPMGDVYLVYEPWSRAALAGAVGITEAWVYPQLAIVPMVLAHLFGWVGGYTLGWALLVTACDAVVFWMLVGRGRSRTRRRAAWFWLAFTALLGPVGMYRIDAVTVPLAIAGLLWLARRPAVAAALLTAAAWIKVWPAALVAAAVIALRRRVAVIAGAAAVTAGVVVAVVVAGGAAHLLGFVTMQAGRGLQLEAPVSTFYLWGSALRLPGWWVFYDQEILTYQVTGPQVDPVIAAMTPLLVLVVGGVALLGVVKARRGAPLRVLLPPLALALVLALIVCNKVGSPQFHDWLIPPLVLWLLVDARRAKGFALAGLASAGLTQLVYPILYDRILLSQIAPVAVLTLRNMLLVAMLAWVIVRLVRVETPVTSTSRAAVR